jgi:hypothetical protein
MVRDAVKGALDRYNISSIIEYRPLSHSSEDGKQKRIRPDGYTHALNDLWDVCVTSPVCQSYIDQNSHSKGLVAAKINENAKAKKYCKIAEKEGHTFTPLVFESFGGFGEKARDFLVRASDMALDVAGGGTMERHEILHDLRCSIAFALVNGNGRLIKNSLLMAEKVRRLTVIPAATASSGMLSVVRRDGRTSLHARHTPRRRVGRS